MRWNPEQYLKFADYRIRPAVDLLGAIKLEKVSSAADIGCGPGNSTEIIASRWPDAALTGLDSSPEMLDAARRRLPGAAFVEGDFAGELNSLGTFDLVFSNAALQFVSDYEQVLSNLFGLVNPCGVLAVQIPVTKGESGMPRLESGSIHRVMEEIAAEPPFSDYIGNIRPFHNLPVQLVWDALSPAAAGVDFWETYYCHRLSGYEDILEWYRGAGMRPYLQALPDDTLRGRFEQELIGRLQSTYPLQKDGSLLFWFRRLFFLVYK